MSRKFQRVENPNLTPWLSNLYEFPKEKDGIIYVRQSNNNQAERHIHSFEMQTDRFLEHFRDIGCTGNIDIITDDEGMSGTLDIHDRPGMKRMVDAIQQDTIGWVAAVHVNRFFRDQWMINPDLFIKECYEHNVIVATLNQTFNFRVEHSQRIFRMEAEEAARFLKTMRLIVGGEKQAASDKGCYDGRFLTVGYIVDRTDPKNKKYVIYEPHAVGVRWLFRRYFELDGNAMELCRELAQMPFLFPKFESWVDPKNVRRLIIKKTESGDYLPTGTGVRQILTNPAYLGIWIPMNGGFIENNHEPIIDEGLFMYAFNRLSSFDLQGNRQKPEAVSQHSPTEALLKKVIKGTRGTVHAFHDDGKVFYHSIEMGKVGVQKLFNILVRTVDGMFLERFFQRIQSLPLVCEGWQDTIERKQTARDMQNQIIKKSIREVDSKMERLAELLADTQTPLPETLKKRYIEEYAGLEAKKKKFEIDLQDKPEDEKDEEIIFEVATLIPEIMEEWDALPFHERMRFVGALVRQVTIDVVGISWFQMTIEWKLPEWGVDIGHLRQGSNGNAWSDEELQILRQMYPTEDALDILNELPTRNWSAVKHKASKLGVARVRTEDNSIRTTGIYEIMTIDGLQYAEEHKLDPNIEIPQWDTEITILLDEEGEPSGFSTTPLLSQAARLVWRQWPAQRRPRIIPEMAGPARDRE